MKELVEHIATSLVDDPAQVTVTEIVTSGLSRMDVIYELRVAQRDMGRMIGRGGRVVNAIRTLVQMCAAREAKRAQLEIIEAE
jgi:predicted RNA-binding protein YlqC (UPF0109 family)